MADALSRTRMLLGDEGLDRLAAARVAVFGLGGVGGYAVEALARSGVGALDLTDGDRISESNLNRQLLATTATLGQFKPDAAAERVALIAPGCKVRTRYLFYDSERANWFDFTHYDYVVDAIDTVSSKLLLVEQARAAGVPIISCMGTGNKLDPSALRISDISETSVCPLARVMRRELKKRGIEHLKVVWSPEPPLCPAPDPETMAEDPARRAVPGSTAFVPAAAGLLLASAVVRDLAGL